MRPPKRRQNDVHPVLLRTTKYYYVLQNDHPVLLRYKVRQNTTPTSERSPSSTTPYYKGLQKLPKQLLEQQASKTSISFATFSQSFPGGFEFAYHIAELSARSEKNPGNMDLCWCHRSWRSSHDWFLSTSMGRLTWPTSSSALLSKSARESWATGWWICLAPCPFPSSYWSIFQARSFQNFAPATQNAKMTSHLESLKRQNEHFVRDFLHFSYFEGKDCVTWREINDAATTTRRHDQHDAVTQVQPQNPTINGNPSLRITDDHRSPSCWVSRTASPLARKKTSTVLVKNTWGGGDSGGRSGETDVASLTKGSIEPLM